MIIQQVIQGQVCCIRTRIIQHPTNKFNAKPTYNKKNKQKKKILTNDDDEDYYCGECAEDDIKQYC